MSFVVRSAFVALLCLGSSAAFGVTKDITMEDRRQAACYDDVQRLCPNTIPDAAKAEACMKDKGSLVSPKCAAFYDVKQ